MFEYVGSIGEKWVLHLSLLGCGEMKAICRWGMGKSLHTILQKFESIYQNKIKQSTKTITISRMEEGWIYCLSNESMPGILKVGSTIDPEITCKQLYTTGVPLPFKIEFAKYVKDYVKKEKTIHKILEQFTDRVNSSREFFKCSKMEVYALLELMEGTYLSQQTKVDAETKEGYDENDVDVDNEQTKKRQRCFAFKIINE
jgi:T5orf172 domain